MYHKIASWTNDGIHVLLEQIVSEIISTQVNFMFDQIFGNKNTNGYDWIKFKVFNLNELKLANDGAWVAEWSR